MAFSSRLPSPGEVRRVREEWEKRVKKLLREAVEATSKVEDEHVRKALNSVLLVLGDLCWFELERLKLAEREVSRVGGKG